MEIKFNPKKNLEYTLKVGELLIIQEGLFVKNYYLGYAGMPSKEVFSMFFVEDYHNIKNLFYPISKKEIETFNDGKFNILEVNPEKIKLKYSEKGK